MAELSNEIYHHIVDQVESLEFESRQKTLVALSSSSRLLRAIAEPR